jgi:pyruvate dehydrogenase E2 component (dihydrolipoamide acetyltransferase)
VPGPAPARGGAGAARRDDSPVAATPVARRLASELGVSLLDCRRSGSRGRVCKADVEARAALQGRAGAAAVEPQPEPTSTAQAPAEEQPLAGMRRTIANRLQQSKQTAPHFRVQVEARIDPLLELRSTLNASLPEARISVNDCIVKACACALLRVPAVNVQFDGETVRRFRDADIAVAVALDEGLITPIVRRANHKGLVEISNEMRDLATRAKLGRLSPEEFQGGTFSVSNLGMFGVTRFDAIINPPQGAILAVGAAEQRPVWRDGAWQAATVLSLTLSSDHRIIDGAVAARFMAALRGFLEQPGTMLG